MYRLRNFALAVATCAIVAATAAAAIAAARYHYVNLDAAVPKGVAFFPPTAVIDNGKVYGTAYRCPTRRLPRLRGGEGRQGHHRLSVRASPVTRTMTASSRVG